VTLRRWRGRRRKRTGDVQMQVRRGEAGIIVELRNAVNLVIDLLQGRSKSLAAATQQPIKREGPDPPIPTRPSRKVQQVRFVSRLSEVSSGRGHRLELDRAEAIRQVYGEYGDKQHNVIGILARGINAPTITASPPINSIRPSPTTATWLRAPECVQNVGKSSDLAPASRTPCSMKPVADDQAEWDRVPSLSQRREKREQRSIKLFMQDALLRDYGRRPMRGNFYCKRPRRALAGMIHA